MASAGPPRFVIPQPPPAVRARSAKLYCGRQPSSRFSPLPSPASPLVAAAATPPAARMGSAKTFPKWATTVPQVPVLVGRQFAMVDLVAGVRNARSSKSPQPRLSHLQLTGSPPLVSYSNGVRIEQREVREEATQADPWSSLVHASRSQMEEQLVAMQADVVQLHHSLSEWQKGVAAAVEEIRAVLLRQNARVDKMVQREAGLLANLRGDNNREHDRDTKCCRTRTRSGTEMLSSFASLRADIDAGIATMQASLREEIVSHVATQLDRFRAELAGRPVFYEADKVPRHEAVELQRSADKFDAPQAHVPIHSGPVLAQMFRPAMPSGDQILALRPEASVSPPVESVVNPAFMDFRSVKSAASTTRRATSGDARTVSTHLEADLLPLQRAEQELARDLLKKSFSSGDAERIDVSVGMWLHPLETHRESASLTSPRGVPREKLRSGLGTTGGPRPGAASTVVVVSRRVVVEPDDAVRE